jgi:surface antigen/peptidoglycan hydrolase CwlO-like protein
LEGQAIKTIRQLNAKSLTTVIGSLAVVLFASGTAFADQFDDQIAALRTQASSQQAQAQAMHAQANDYRSKVAELNAQIVAVQTQINLNTAQFNRVTASIEANKAKLDEQKVILSANIKSMYLNSATSPIEMLASNNNLSDFLDQQSYQDKIKNKIQEAMSAITILQKQLEGQQQQLTLLLTQQRTQHDTLAANQAEVNRLLALAETNAAAADADVRNSNSKIATLKAQQAAILAAASRGVHGAIPGASGGRGGACDNGYGNGGYPMSWCGSPQDSITTPWGYSRECVSWAGWRRSQMGRAAYAWGNANQWDDGARASGFRVDYSPEVGAVAQTDAGFYGHVAVVEAVDGGDVIVSEMNYDGDGHYRMARYSSSYFKYIH